MKNKNVWQAVKFTLFSASAGLIQLISFALLHDVFKIPDYNACYLPSLILSVLWNFTFNRRYTFRSDGNVKRAMLLVALCRKCSSCACPVRATRTRRAARISRRSACCTRSATR